MSEEVKNVVEQQANEKETTNALESEKEETQTESVSSAEEEKVESENKEVAESKPERPEINQLRERIRKLENELKEEREKNAQKDASLKASQDYETAIKTGIEDTYISDLFAIIRGNNEEINEETITKYAGQHPEWKKVTENNGITELGTPHKEVKVESEKNSAFKLFERGLK